MAVDCFDSAKMFEIWKTFQQQQHESQENVEKEKNFLNKNYLISQQEFKNTENKNNFESLFSEEFSNAYNNNKKPHFNNQIAVASQIESLTNNSIIFSSTSSLSPSSSLSSVNNQKQHQQHWQEQNNLYSCWKPKESKDTLIPLFSSWNNVYNWINSTNPQVNIY